MATTTEIRYGSFTWTHSSLTSAEDEQIDDVAGDCITCGAEIGYDENHWYCTDNGEIACEGCELPDFDSADWD